MRVPKIAIVISTTFLIWNTQKALAQSQSVPEEAVKNVDVVPVVVDTPTPLSTQAVELTPINSDAQYGNYVAPALPQQLSQEGIEPVEATQKVVRDVQIRFVNKKGQTVNSKGQPIQGRTRKDFIIGELRLKPGHVFRQDLLRSDLARLRRLEPFEKVNASVEEDATGVVIVYDIRERHYPEITPGIDQNDDIGYNGTLAYRDANIGGVDDQLSGQIQVSAKDVQFQAQFVNPYRASEPDSPGYSIRGFRSREYSRTFTDEVKLADGSTIREGSFGGGVAVLGRSFGDLDGALGLNYTRISVRNRDYNVVRRDALGNPLSLSGTGIDDLVTVSFAVTRDRRDRRDIPTQGSIISLSTDQSLPIGLGDVVRNRLKANYIEYVPVHFLGRGQFSENPEMVAVNFQVGTILGDFPPSEAFNLGGKNSVRGYGAGRVANGRSYALASIEYRFPILRTLGAVFFVDIGSDLGSDGAVLGKPAVVRNKPGTGFGTGVGLRIGSPIGLIRSDLAISDQGEVRLEVTTGQRF